MARIAERLAWTMSPLNCDYSANVSVLECGFMHCELIDVVGNAREASGDAWNELDGHRCMESYEAYREVAHEVRSITKCFQTLYMVVYSVVSDAVHASTRAEGGTIPTITELLLGCSLEVRRILRLLFFLT